MTTPPLLDLLTTVDDGSVVTEQLRLPRGGFRYPHEGFCLQYVQSGVVVLARETDDGREVVDDIKLSGDLILPIRLGETSPVPHASTSTPVLRAAVESVIVQCTSDRIEELFEERPDIQMAFLPELASSLRARTERVSDLALYPSQTRVARMYVDLHHRLRPNYSTPDGWLVHELSQHALARFVGVTRETFNRINQSMVERHMIEIDHGRFRLRRLGELQRIGCYVDRNSRSRVPSVGAYGPAVGIRPRPAAIAS